MTVVIVAIQSLNVDSRRLETPDPAASPHLSSSHTVAANSSGSDYIETLDLTAIPPVSPSLHSHMPSRIDTRISMVDAEAISGRYAVAGLLACSHTVYFDHTPDPAASPPMPASPESPSSMCSEPPSG